jgi:hypothetical protein
MMLYNEQQSEPKKLVMLTQNAIHEVTGARFDAIKAFLDAHKQEITQYHASLPFPIRRSGKLGHLGALIPCQRRRRSTASAFWNPCQRSKEWMREGRGRLRSELGVAQKWQDAAGDWQRRRARL